MNKKSISLVSVLLLITLCVPAAMAAPHPNQMGDPGGVAASQYGNGTRPPQNNAAESAPATAAVQEQQPETAAAGEYVPILDGDGVAVIYPDQNYQSEVPVLEVTEAPKSGTQTLDWYANGFDLINKYKSIKVYDVNTGVTWGATYINGKNHADVIPASKADADKIAKNNITGSYVRRPVLVTINGTQYAGSMYAVGHGDTSYCNYFKGVMCIHFTGSQTHGSKQVDKDHQNAINDAMNYGN